ncbi:hypothetical protein AGABI1DRAFT_135424 [Agaricus bisporus var. burnettii JB137-S8]|uniref:Uncharacterized protein n=1 Tax=Agaricus bisporus var. burnettii (strain JB137-S8 / ATCC MYA-4627 / FGSC 10392) TaxID=597362 RepID=K5WD81_AGABU|nr:uncharacterized protein AGABI1DRAFT_135424 [Agaricus bisporus var. burnettii JB137-S8]EKM73181.1 hypothetical protein AGABI1DRAFT_135424 [Agaricus bisporus var. burnettii JB137-S8]
MENGGKSDEKCDSKKIPPKPHPHIILTSPLKTLPKIALKKRPKKAKKRPN